MGDLEESVRKACSKITARDYAVRDLALTYARSLDNGGDLTKIGPALLAALEALQLSPRARKAVTPVAGRVLTNPLDQLAARRAGKSRTTPVDGAAPRPG